MFVGVISYCIFVILGPKLKKDSGVAEIPAEANEPAIAECKKNERRQYTVDFLRVYKSHYPVDEDARDYSIVIKAPDFTLHHSPTPYRSSRKSPDPLNFLRKHTPEPTEFVSRSPRGRLDADEEREYNQSMRELTPDYCPMAAEELPQDIKMGRVHWLHQRSGRIHVPEPIHGIKDIFFHMRDCELEPGDEIKLGDSVMFELSLFEGRLCAVKVKKMTANAIPSPDFSRRVMKQSKQELPQIEALSL